MITWFSNEQHKKQMADVSHYYIYLYCQQNGVEKGVRR